MGHWFCSSCVKAGVENQIGQNTTNTSCLADCAGKFSLQILQRILDPKVFAKFCQRVQEDELKMAEIEGLEFCVKCGHPNVCDEGNTVFTCINEECKKETCRLCKEDVHLPKRCDEIEKDVEVKQRTKIEEQMTEAMIRNCYNCKTPFIKEQGCNKMQCKSSVSFKIRTEYHYFFFGRSPMLQKDVLHLSETGSRLQPFLWTRIRSNPRKMSIVHGQSKPSCFRGPKSC